MAGILRGDIHRADLNPVIGSEQGGFRPVLILSHNIFNDRSGTVIAVAMSFVLLVLYFGLNFRKVS